MSTVPSTRGAGGRIATGRTARLMAKVPSMNRPQGRRTTTRPILNSFSAPPAIIWALVVLFFGLIAPEYLIYSANSAMPIAITCFGLLILVGWAREISLATAGLFASAIYLDGFLNREVGRAPGWPWVWAAIVTILVMAVALALLAMSSAKLPGLYMVVLTLGMQVVIERTVYANGLLSGGLGGGDQDGYIIQNRRPMIFGWNVANASTQQFYLFTLAWLAIVMGLVVRLRRSPMGLAFNLVGADRQAAAAVGISPLKFRVYAFTASGILAGIGGILANWLYVSPPVFYNYLSPYSLLLLAIPVLAGLDSIAFVLVVAAGFQMVPVLLESLRISTYILASVGLIGGATFGSRGIGGTAQDAYRYLRYGNRTTRTHRDSDTALLRKTAGLATEADQIAGLSEEERHHALELLESWLPPRPSTDIAIRVENVTVTHGIIKALNGPSLTVPAGSMVGLLGPNGAGKTTLFDVISGLRRPNSGTVQLFGQDVTNLSAWDRSKLGMSRTFQTTRVMPELTVADNMIAGAYQRIKASTARFLAGDPRAWAQMRHAEEVAYAAAQLLGIDRYWNERAGTLEFSARRRTEIGRCLLTGPRLLLLDEPAAGLDPASSAALFALVKKLHEDLGLTVLLVEHYVKAVLESCDLVYVLAEGQVLASGTPGQVANNPEVRTRYLGTRMRYTTTEDEDVAVSADAPPKADPLAGTASPPGDDLGRHVGTPADGPSARS